LFVSHRKDKEDTSLIAWSSSSDARRFLDDDDEEEEQEEEEQEPQPPSAASVEGSLVVSYLDPRCVRLSDNGRLSLAVNFETFSDTGVEITSRRGLPDDEVPGVEVAVVEVLAGDGC
jgi:hypothetical protein